MTPALAAATAMAAAIQAASDADELTREVAAEATYWSKKKPEEYKSTEPPTVLVMPRSVTAERGQRGPTRKYETTIRVALRTIDPAPDSIDPLFDSIVAIVDRDERFAGLAVIRVAMAEIFDADLYGAIGVVGLNADVDLMGYVTND